jgi:hypothetical protein
MSTLWTPSGEHPVDRPGRPTPDAPSGPPPGTAGAAAAAEAGEAAEPELTPEQQAAAEEYARQLDDARRQLLDMPAGVVIGQQALQFYDLAVLHLGQPEPHLDEARVAIDALAAVVEALGARLGEAETPLRQALNQLQLAFVSVSSGHPPATP